MGLRTARITAGLRLHFPCLAVGTDVHVPTPLGTAVAVPPMALDSHLSIISAGDRKRVRLSAFHRSRGWPMAPADRRTGVRVHRPLRSQPAQVGAGVAGALLRASRGRFGRLDHIWPAALVVAARRRLTRTW